jgi:hypothetical protein
LKPFVYGGKMMNTMRKAWTDERLDDLNERVGEMGRRMDDGFHRVNEEIGGVRGEIGLLRTYLDGKIDMKVDGLRTETKTEFSAVHAELASLHRLMVQLTGGVIVTIVATQIASRL